MKLVLLRHGIAIDRMDPHCPSDEERWLTRKGIRRTLAACRGLAALEVEPDLVLSSPLVRARQTAEIAAEALGDVEVRLSDTLRGGLETDAVFAELAALGLDCVVAVGHAPQMDALLARALTPSHGPLERMKKAGAAMVELDDATPGTGRLAWQMQPRALRALGRA